MISVSEARNKVLENCPLPKLVRMPLGEACEFVLAEPLHAPMDTPHFDQSAMDGYAFAFDNWDGTSDLIVSAEVQAGSFSTEPIKPHEAMRIFTGAAIPEGADTVVIQENAVKEGNRISIKNNNLSKGSNVRLSGSQTKKGVLILNEGHLISPATVAFLAGLGVQDVPVYSNPIVRIIATGKELVMPGESLDKGKIYESNSFGLIAALRQMGIVPVSAEIVDDDAEMIVKAIVRNLKTDVLILTGGVSVGDYDFVTTSLEKCGVQKVFHSVKQKPGKPLYFGTHGQTLVFGLPGNPASVLTCFYEYVVSAISSLTKKEYFKRLHLPLANDFLKKLGLTFFLKGKISGDKVAVLDDQESYKMNSFAVADCLIELEAERDEFRKGEIVSVQLIQ